METLLHEGSCKDVNHSRTRAESTPVFSPDSDMGTLMPANSLTWALVVATYMREDLLPRCLRLGAAQTRPPLEIVIVDSSPGWESTRERVLREIAPLWPGIRWHYVEAV